MRRPWSACLLLFTATACLAFTAGPAAAQVQVQAYSGEPLGVGRISIRAPRGDRSLPITDDAVELFERAGRVLYPAFDSGPVRQALRNLLGRRRELTAYFLFPGNDPLTLSFRAAAFLEQPVAPIPDPVAARALLDTWWEQYVRNRRQGLRNGGYPPVVENYLMATLARRLGLPVPDLLAQEPTADPELRALESLLTTPAVYVAIQQERLLGLGEPERRTIELPAPPQAPPYLFAEPEAEVPIEPLAMHVPPECFYVRFGNFANFQWMRALVEEWGGDLENLITERGLDYELNLRNERRLALKESAFSRLLGGAVISDVALIGFDFYLQEGAAVGVLFEARNNFLLSQSIAGQREEAIENNPQATLSDVEIAGNEVSLLATPDRSIRSFYAVDGSYHLVTTSEQLVRRFFEVGENKQSLGASAEFRNARSAMPLDREDTIFLYLSDAFFRNLVSPHYRIELMRRLYAAVDLELVQVAEEAAGAEGLEVEGLEGLVEAGLLPPNFLTATGGSRPVPVAGRWLDSVRGLRGSFVPIPDIPVTRITPSEARRYEEFAAVYLENWDRLAPVTIAIRRVDDAEAPESLERVVVDARVAPITERNMGMLARVLGPPLRNQVAALPGDAAHFEASVSGELTAQGPHRLFGGVRGLGFGDNGPEGPGGLFGPIMLVDGYWGAAPHPGVVGVVTSFLARVSAGLLGAPMITNGEFTVASADPRLANAALAQLHYEPAVRPAQLRLRLEDLENTRVASIINALGYRRARRISEGNAHLLNILTTQLKVPRPQALNVAEEILDAELMCPLGGEYRLLPLPSGVVLWQSTALAGQPRPGLLEGAPPGYTFPVLQWFRGVDLDVLLEEPRLMVHAELLMQRRAMPEEAKQPRNVNGEPQPVQPGERGEAGEAEPRRLPEAPDERPAPRQVEELPPPKPEPASR